MGKNAFSVWPPGFLEWHSQRFEANLYKSILKNLPVIKTGFFLRILFLICWVSFPSLYIVFLDSSLGLKKYEKLPDGFCHLPQSHCGVRRGKGRISGDQKPEEDAQLPKFCSLHESGTVSRLRNSSCLLNSWFVLENEYIQITHIFYIYIYISKVCSLYISSLTTNRKTLPCRQHVSDFSPLDSHTVVMVS